MYIPVESHLPERARFLAHARLAASDERQRLPSDPLSFGHSSPQAKFLNAAEENPKNFYLPCIDVIHIPGIYLV